MKSRYLAAAVFLVLSASASANSLWTPESKALISDTRARQVGDIVTITVSESTSSSQKESSSFNKSLKHSNDSGVGPIANRIPQIKVTSSQTGAAGGATSSTLSFSGTIAAKVVKVLPGGVLQVEGTHHIEASNEKQDVIISGLVRPEDIDVNNTVSSAALADLQVRCTGKGAVSDRQKEGLISKIVKFLF